MRVSSAESQTWFMLLVDVHKKRSKLTELNFLLRACSSFGNFPYVHIGKKVESNCVAVVKYECHREVKKERDFCVLRSWLEQLSENQPGAKPQTVSIIYNIE